MLRIFTDGGSRGNPGPSSSAFVIYSNEKKIFETHRYWGVGTNNEAEYKAVVIALEWLIENPGSYKGEKIFFFLDSELVVRQLTGVYKIKDLKLIKFAQKIKLLEEKFGDQKPSYSFVRRELNKVADSLVNESLDENSEISR